MGKDLPAVWQAPTTTNTDRKQLLRLVIQSVLVDGKQVQGQLWYQINWQTGATDEHWLLRNVQSYAEHPQLERLQQRVRELNGAHKMDAQIAATLNAEGLRSARGQPFSGHLVWLLRQHWQLPSVKENAQEPNPPRWADGTYSVEGLAQAVDVSLWTVYRWVRTGRIKGQQPAKGMPWKLSLTEAQIASLRVYAQRVRRTKQSILS